jgi:ketosteroid isomerase-like protein
VALRWLSGRAAAALDRETRATDTGHHTGIDVASGNYAMVFTFRDGLIVHAKFYARRSDALQAAGVSA